jgi:acylphosphatase
MIARRSLVSGRVQGVFYRGATRQRALELGLSGYAHNLSDGRVEVLAIGDAAAVDALVRWLAIGPPAAHVTAVETHDVATDSIGDINGFTIR